MAIQAFPTPPHHLRETKEEKKRKKINKNNNKSGRNLCTTCGR
jgi:hypothetical protein